MCAPAIWVFMLQFFVTFRSLLYLLHSDTTLFIDSIEFGCQSVMHSKHSDNGTHGITAQKLMHSPQTTENCECLMLSCGYAKDMATVRVTKARKWKRSRESFEDVIDRDEEIKNQVKNVVKRLSQNSLSQVAASFHGWLGETKQSRQGQKNAHPLTRLGWVWSITQVNNTCLTQMTFRKKRNPRNAFTESILFLEVGKNATWYLSNRPHLSRFNKHRAANVKIHFQRESLAGRSDMMRHSSC